MSAADAEWKRGGRVARISCYTRQQNILPCFDAARIYQAGVGGAVFRLGMLRAAVNGVSRIVAGASLANTGKVYGAFSACYTQNQKFTICRYTFRAGTLPAAVPRCPYPVELSAVSVNAPGRVSAGLCRRWYNFKGVSACGSLWACCFVW